MSGHAPKVGPGTRLGRYEVVKHLATGGMAEVLLARTAGPMGFVRHDVVKRIRAQQANDPRFVKMFLEEARLAATLHHQNIIKVHDIGEQAGLYYFAMEYLHGKDLSGILGEVSRLGIQVPIEKAVTIIAAAAAGLHHAHEQVGSTGDLLGLVHRDVSPGNILVGYDGSVKVADFGIAKATLSSIDTRSGMLKGKVSYMSPEQIVGAAELDRRSDIFSLGIVLYETLTARRLFRRENDFLTMAAIVQADVPPPSKYRPDIPRKLEQIVLRTLAAKPAGRYPSAAELGSVLERFATDSGFALSHNKLADYMKDLFGAVQEPWLVDEELTSTDRQTFINSLGVVDAPITSVDHLTIPSAVSAEPTSLIAEARRAAVTERAPIVPRRLTPAVERTEFDTTVSEKTSVDDSPPALEATAVSLTEPERTVVEDLPKEPTTKPDEPLYDDSADRDDFAEQSTAAHARPMRWDKLLWKEPSAQPQQFGRPLPMAPRPSLVLPIAIVLGLLVTAGLTIYVLVFRGGDAPKPVPAITIDATVIEIDAAIEIDALAIDAAEPPVDAAERAASPIDAGVREAPDPKKKRKRRPPAKPPNNGLMQPD